MKTLNTTSQWVAARFDWKRHEQEDSRRITKALPRGVPASIKEPVYGCWKGKRRLMGTFPEVATQAVVAGADPADVLAFCHRLERTLILLRIRTHGITEAQARKDETDAQYALDEAQFEWEAKKTRETYAALVEATRRVQIATMQLELVAAMHRPVGVPA